jgi:hypothetical protein
LPQGAAFVDEGHDEGQPAVAGAEAAWAGVPRLGFFHALGELHALKHVAHHDADADFVGVEAIDCGEKASRVKGISGMLGGARPTTWTCPRSLNSRDGCMGSMRLGASCRRGSALSS